MTNKQPHEDMYISKLRDSGELCILIGGCVVKRELDQNFHAFPGPIVLVYLLLKEDRQMDKTVKNNWNAGKSVHHNTVSPPKNGNMYWLLTYIIAWRLFQQALFTFQRHVSMVSLQNNLISSYSKCKVFFIDILFTDKKLLSVLSYACAIQPLYHLLICWSCFDLIWFDMSCTSF